MPPDPPPFPTASRVFPHPDAMPDDGTCAYAAMPTAPRCPQPATYRIRWGNGATSPACDVHTAWARSVPATYTIVKVETYAPH